VSAQFANCQTPPWMRNVCCIAHSRYQPTMLKNTKLLGRQSDDNFSTICHRNNNRSVAAIIAIVNVSVSCYHPSFYVCGKCIT